MRPLISFCLLLLLFPVASPGQPLATSRPTTGAVQDGRVYVLVTVGQGDAVWEKFGHNLIRLMDVSGGRVVQDVSINWGLFDFDKPNFIGNFILGRSIYTMGPVLTRPELDLYRGQDRALKFDRLDFSPAQAARLQGLLENNLKDGNRDYRYDYFADNCSTRVRDAIDAATGGQLKKQAQATPVPYTLRSEALRLTADDFLVSCGQDFLLGRPTDRALSAWDGMFLPGRLEDFVSKMNVTDERTATPRPLVGTTQAVRTEHRGAEPATPPARWRTLALIGLGCAGGAVWLAAGGRWRYRAAVGVLMVWSLVAGLAGGLLAFLWLFTDHTAAYRNENLIAYSPLSLVLLVALPLIRRPAALRFARRLSKILVALTIVGLLVKLLPGPAQMNWGWLTLAALMHAATAWVLKTYRAPPFANPAPDAGV